MSRQGLVRSGRLRLSALVLTPEVLERSPLVSPRVAVEQKRREPAERNRRESGTIGHRIIVQRPVTRMSECLRD